MELVVRMKRLFTELGTPVQDLVRPDSVAWTEVPSRIACLGGNATAGREA